MISAKSLAAMSLLEHFIWFTFSCFSCVYISLIKYFQWNEHTLKQINSQSIYTYYIIHIHHIKRWNDWIRTISRVKMPYIYKAGPVIINFPPQPKNRSTSLESLDPIYICPMYENFRISMLILVRHGFLSGILIRTKFWGAWCVCVSIRLSRVER